MLEIPQTFTEFPDDPSLKKEDASKPIVREFDFVEASNTLLDAKDPSDMVLTITKFIALHTNIALSYGQAHAVLAQLDDLMVEFKKKLPGSQTLPESTD